MMKGLSATGGPRTAGFGTVVLVARALQRQRGLFVSGYIPGHYRRGLSLVGSRGGQPSGCPRSTGSRRGRCVPQTPPGGSPLGRRGLRALVDLCAPPPPVPCRNLRSLRRLSPSGFVGVVLGGSWHPFTGLGKQRSPEAAVPESGHATVHHAGRSREGPWSPLTKAMPKKRRRPRGTSVEFFWRLEGTPRLRLG
jgi:hypothetical protein